MSDPVCSMNCFSVLNISFISVICGYISLNRKRTISVFENGKIEDLSWKKSQLVVSCQVVTNLRWGLVVFFCSFILHLISSKTINIPDIFSGVHGFTGNTSPKEVQAEKDCAFSASLG